MKTEVQITTIIFMATTTYKGKKSICIFSYNSRGFTEDKQDICKLLMTNTDNYYLILCNQENFLLKGNNYKVSQCLTDSRIIFKKAVKLHFKVLVLFSGNVSDKIL